MSLLQDLAYTFRSLCKTPGFSIVVILTLELGIGANTTVFSLINVLLRRPASLESEWRLALRRETFAIWFYDRARGWRSSAQLSE